MPRLPKVSFVDWNFETPEVKWFSGGELILTKNIFAGFSAQALADRIEDSNCKVLVPSDGGLPGRENRPAEGNRART